MVQAGPLRIKLSRAALPLLTLLLLALLALTYYSPPESAYARLGVKDLPNLILEATQGLNHSTRLLSSSFGGSLVNASGHIHRMRMVAVLLLNASELPELQASELGEQLREAAASYAHAASAAADIAAASEEISAAYRELREFLIGVKRCDFHTARESALALDPALRRAQEALRRALKHLAGVDEDALLSENHRRVYFEAIEAASKAVKALENLLTAVELVRLADAAELERACRGDPAFFAPDVVSVASRLRPSESGDFGYEVALLKSYVLGSRGQQGTGSGQGGWQGGGAGWGEPQGDD